MTKRNNTKNARTITTDDIKTCCDGSLEACDRVEAALAGGPGCDAWKACEAEILAR
jgi:hypothetical protein